MRLFAFEITFNKGAKQTLFFYDWRIETALLRAPEEARRLYGARASEIVNISESARFSATPAAVDATPARMRNYCDCGDYCAYCHPEMCL